jgi:hypothetical protein
MGSPEGQSPPPAESPNAQPVGRSHRRWRWWLLAAVMGLSVAVFAIGLFLGHWFGFGEEVWSRVTLPMDQVEAQMPISEFPPWVTAQQELEVAWQAREAALAFFGPGVVPKDEAEEEWRQAQLALTDAGERLGVAQVALDDAMAAYEATTPESQVSSIVAAAEAELGAESEDTIRSGLADAEWVFCELNGDKVLTAAVSLGFLPESDEYLQYLTRYWHVQRPEEYIRACRTAFTLR